MKLNKNLAFLLSVTAILSLPLLSFACSTTKAQADAPMAGATLWQQQCIRCHNYRTPAAYSDTQWETILLHMRTRANLPAEDSQAILEFLQSAN